MRSRYGKSRSYMTGGPEKKSASLFWHDYKVFIIAWGVALLALIGFLIWQTTWLNALWLSVRSSAWLWVMGIGLIGLIIAGLISERKWLVWSLVGVMVLAIAGMWVTASYVSSKKVYEASVTVSQPEDGVATVPEYNERAPLVVARAQTDSNLTINGSAEDTTYIAGADRFGAVARKPGITDGYGQVVYQQIGPNGQSINAEGRVGNQNCSFSENAGKRFGGWFDANLKREILHQRWGVIIDTDDSYAYCTDEGKAMFIVPLKKYVGFFGVYEIPAGVAVYDGETGDLEILDEVTAEDNILGPVYPVSLSVQSRESSRAAGSWWDFIQNRVGYSDTTGDENDPNRANAGEFTLHRQDGSRDEYVTPMVMRGRGSAITAIGTVSSSEVTRNELNPYQINVLPEYRQANSAVADKIHTDYSSLDWAAGLEVFEIAPTGPDSWSATLGRSKSILYRMTIEPDASSCLYDLSGNKIRCTNEAPEEMTNDLVGLTDDQLLELQREVQAEIEKRFRER